MTFLSFLPYLILLCMLGLYLPPTMCRVHGLLGLYCFPSFPHGLGNVRAEVSALPAHWAFISIIPFPTKPMSLLAVPCWPIRFITSFLGLPRPIYLVFTSYCDHGPISCYSCHASPLGLLPLFLDFFSPFIFSLPLIMSMGLLVVIPTTLAHWAYDHFSWASSIHLLYLYPLLRSWAY